MRNAVMLLLMVLVVGVAAQGGYTAHTPTLEEYLAVIFHDLELKDLRVLEIELNALYPDLQWRDFALVTRIYQKFRATGNDLDDAFWTRLRVISWLTTHEVDLDRQRTIEVSDATMEVTAADFDGDRQNEWALNYRDPTLNGFLFLDRDEVGRYRLAGQPFEFKRSSRFELVAVQDFTDDGLPDAAILDRRDHEEYLYLVTWQNGIPVNVSDESVRVSLPAMALQWIVQEPGIHTTYEMRDQWECTWMRRVIFDWNGIAFATANQQDDFPETFACGMRFAEESMWQGRYRDAINLYNWYVEFNPVPRQYARFRLALALILTGDNERGISILKAMQSEGHLLPLVERVLSEYRGYAVGACLAAYDYFASTPDAIWLAEGLEVANVPERAGCDFPALLNRALDRARFRTSRSPLYALRAQGVIAPLAHTGDFNDDKIKDWIVWLPTRAAPIFFLSNRSTYVVSRPYLSNAYPPGEDNVFTNITLPNGKAALLNVDYASPVADATRTCADAGNVTIWTVWEYELVPFLSTPVCGRGPIFRRNEIRGYALRETGYEPVTYVWDEGREAYFAPEPPPTYTELPVEDHFALFDDPFTPFLQSDYDTLLQRRDEGLYYYPEVTRDDRYLRWRYLTALAMTRLYGVDQALAEYVAIYESVPESAWGKLAALHFEEIKP